MRPFTGIGWVLRVLEKRAGGQHLVALWSSGQGAHSSRSSEVAVGLRRKGFVSPALGSLHVGAFHHRSLCLSVKWGCWHGWFLGQPSLCHCQRSSCEPSNTEGAGGEGRWRETLHSQRIATWRKVSTRLVNAVLRLSILKASVNTAPFLWHDGNLGVISLPFSPSQPPQPLLQHGQFCLLYVLDPSTSF